MALGNNNSAIYLKISDGKVVRQFKESTPNSVSRLNKNNKTVHEELYDYVEGVITGISTKENEYGKFWVININDDGTNYILEMSYSGGTASAFLKALPHVNFAARVRIKPKQTIEGDKKRNTVFLSQNDKALKWFWTKDNPGEMPELKKIKVKGKETYDDSEIMEFLENYVTENIVPKIGAGVEEDF